MEIDLIERGRRVLQLRQNFHHHMIAVELGEILVHLALTEGVVEDVVDELRLNAEPRGLVPVRS